MNDPTLNHTVLNDTVLKELKTVVQRAVEPIRATFAPSGRCGKNYWPI